jgi:signal transduction histidine kinase
MKINNIEDLKKSINQSTIFIFIAILFSSLIILCITHNQFVQKRTLLNKQELINTANIFKSNLSEKLSIISSSTVFLDYLRSGYETRHRLYSQFLLQMSSLNSKSILGMELIDYNGKIIFSDGKSSKIFIDLKLCYLNQTLNPIMGDCRYSWKLYFNEADLLQEILFINNDIKPCERCVNYDFFNDDYFGSFPIKKKSNLNLSLHIPNENDYYFYIYLVLIVSALVLFGSWSWYRLSTILNNYIANPIKDLTDRLKNNVKLERNNHIEEIQFLIGEINTWKLKLNKIQSDKHSEKLGKIAAQLAHDVRSPLSAIDMLIKNLTHIPEQYRLTLHKATQRISDIANNFLNQYKFYLPASIEISNTNEHIPSIFEQMISEKRSQYIDRDIEIILSIHDNAWDAFSFINPIDFKRVLSNLINNSVESIDKRGNVNIYILKLNEFIHIEFTDDGCGISEDLLPIISSRGVSIGKKNGSGLGLSHAISKIREWKGHLNIESTLGLGTKITIDLPLSKSPPPWFRQSLSVSNNTIICMLDDEPYAHNLLNKKLTKLKDNSLLVRHLNHLSELSEFISNYTAHDIIYLIDYDLGCALNGLDVIKKFNIQKNATLVSNRYDDPLIQKICAALNVKLIPKNYILQIPIYYQ